MQIILILLAFTSFALLQTQGCDQQRKPETVTAASNKPVVSSTPKPEEYRVAGNHCLKNESCLTFVSIDKKLTDEKALTRLSALLSQENPTKKTLVVYFFDSFDLAKSFAEGKIPPRDLDFYAIGAYRYDDKEEYLKMRIIERKLNHQRNDPNGSSYLIELANNLGRSNLTQKTDARGVKTMYSFDLLAGGGQDPLNRLQKVSYDHTGPMDTSLSIHAAQPTFYTYMTSGDKSRVQGIYTQSILAEEFTYDVEGRVSENKQTVQYRPNHPFTTNYLYDSLDRIKEVHYPAQYGLAGSPRKIVANTYDTASRLSTMTVGGQTAASDIVYNASDQTTQMKVGTAGTNQVTEEYTFDPQTGLLTNQKATKNGSTTLLDLSYQ